MPDRFAQNGSALLTLPAFVLIGLLSAASHAGGAEPDEDGDDTTRLVFHVSPAEEGKEIPGDALDATVTAVQQRLDTAITGGSARRLRENQIEVLIPTADPDQVDRVRTFITRPGTLEFAILANRRDHAELIAAAQTVDDEHRDEDGELRARWTPANLDEGGTPRELYNRGEVATRTVERDGRQIKEYLVVFEPQERRLTSDHIVRAAPGLDESGRPAVDFEFDRGGAALMRELTGRNRPTRDGFERRLGILIDGRIYQAPSIRTQIGARGQITGLSDREAEELAALLRLGRLPVPITSEPIAENAHRN